MNQHSHRVLAVGALAVGALLLLFLLQRVAPVRSLSATPERGEPAALSVGARGVIPSVKPRAARADRLAEPTRVRTRDTALSAVPTDAPSVVVLQAGALMGLPLGRMLLRCLQPTSKHAPAIELAAAERLVFAQLGNKRGLSLATGQFDSKPEGAATLAEDPDGDDLLIQSDDATVVQEAQERIKKGADQAIEANADYGDAHGRLDAKTASLLLPPELAGQVGNSDLQFAFHLDATDALQLTIDASGSATTAGEIAHAVERTLRDMREEARDAGELALVRLLDSCEFRVTPDGFRLEATVAPELAAEILRGCAGEDGATPS